MDFETFTSSTPRVAIKRVNPLLDADAWDAVLTDFPAATVFHTAAWARVLNEAYGHEPFYFVAGTTAGGRALLPMMEVNSWLTGRRAVSLPFTDECEPLFTDRDDFASLLDEVMALARTRSWRSFECRGNRSLFPSAPASTSFHGHTLDLIPDAAALFDRLASPVRRAIRKGEKSPVTIEFATTAAAVRDFYGLLCLTRRRHGLPPQPYRFFAAIQRHLLARHRGFIVLARLANRPIAGAVFLRFVKRAVYKFGASNADFQQHRANNLVMWAAIKRLAREGMKVLDFGRTSLGNEGLRRFKLNWGTAERTIDYVRFDVRRSTYVTARDAASGWHNRVFRNLPISASRALGAILYPHIG